MKVALRMAHELPADAVAGALVEELARSKPAPEKEPKIVAIVKAEYGAAGTWLDVTDKVRAGVRNNSLSIEAGNSLAGDPVQGVVKQLRVTYTLDGQQHTVEVPEGETLQLQGDFTPHPRQVLLISVLGDIGAKGAAPAVLETAKAGPLDMRLAAIRALATLGDASAVAVLLDAAEAEGELGEAARESLAALPGKEVDAALAEMLGQSQGPKLLALIDLVGRRGIGSAAPALVKLAKSDDEQVRAAAIAALGPTAGPAELPALLDRLVKAEPAEAAVAVKAALTKACQRMPDRDACAAVLIGRMDGAPGLVKRDLLDLLGVVGGAKALEGVTAAAKSNIPPLQDAATRVLGTWMSPDAAPVLLDLAKTMELAQFRVRALRGYLRIARQLDVPIEGRIDMCRKALEAAMRGEEKQLALEVLGRYPTADGLALVLPYLEDEALKQPAADAAVAIAEKIAGDDPATVADAMDKVLRSTPTDETAAKARRLRNRARRKGGQ
jgi:HEAT repeat protein